MAESDPPASAPAAAAAQPEGNIWYRRSILGLAGLWALAAVGAGGVVAFVRSGFPRVLFEPPTRFRAGRPEEYALGEVNNQFVESQRVFLVRTSEGIVALLARCTHLGCTPRWLELERKFKCPCHGSVYTSDGVNVEGPAPAPLVRLGISLDEDGFIAVDRSRQFRVGEWNQRGALLRL
ncbi:MAG TPA: ubiquinol-cytochrome c reductase iron-sulfur subunit [Anaeromyxobacter sp.]